MCICVSFIIMIVSLSVCDGFRREIRAGVGALSGDVRLAPVGTGVLSAETADPVPIDAPYLEALRGLEGVESVAPVVYTPGVVKTSDNIHGILFKGVDSTLCALGPMEASIPSSFAKESGLGPGDTFVAYFIRDGKSIPRKFKVASVFRSIIDEKDKIFIICRIAELQRINLWESGSASAFEVTLTDDWKTPAGLEAKEQEIGAVTLAWCEEDENTPTVYATSSLRTYPALFDWLNLIDSNVSFILILMMIVAGFNMMSGLLIMLFENISTIGILKSLGMRDRDISRLFRRIASRTVVVAMLFGNVIAVALCLVQKYTGLIRLNPENYFVSCVPVELSPMNIAVVDILSYLVIILLVNLPLLFIKRVDPAESMRVE